MAGESLANGGRLGLSALNIKKYKDHALSDEILLDKDTGLFYYKNPQGQFISVDLGVSKQSYINTVRNELDDMGIANYNLIDLNIDPSNAIADKNIVNASGTDDDYIEINTKTLDQLITNYLYLCILYMVLITTYSSFVIFYTLTSLPYKWYSLKYIKNLRYLYYERISYW